MAEPIIFTLLLGDNDQISKKIFTQDTQALPTIIKLQTNKESPISDKERIFSEILEKSSEENKIPIFNVQLNDNDTKPIFKLKDITNLKNLGIKNIITFSRYNSLADNSELTTYWKEIFSQVDHVFFANKQDQELAINENIISKDKTTVIQANDIDSVISVFNSLVEAQKNNQFLSGTVPDKKELDKIIKTTKNQNGRVIIKTWPLSLDEATNLITAKFGITSEDQIYGLKLEINEILKDPNNAAKNLEKYVAQISQQFQKDLGKSEINPIDFSFDREAIMKNTYDDNRTNQVNEQIKSPEPIKENQPVQPSFFRRVFNYFKDTIKAIFSKKEEPPVPQSQPMTKTESELNELPKEQTQQPALAAPKQQAAQQPTTSISDDIANITKPDYLYNEDDIKKILEANLDQNKFSIFHHASLKEPEILKDTLRSAVEDLVVNNKPSIIPLNTGAKHWLLLTTEQDNKGNIKFIYNDPMGYPIENRPEVTKYITEVYPDAKISDLKTPQQRNAYDCGVFICDDAIKLANNRPILTTKEAENKGQELRNQHAAILTKAMTKQQAQEIGQQTQNKHSTKYRESVTRVKANDTSRGL